VEAGNICGMSEIEDIRQRLAKIHLTLKAPPKRIQKILDEVLEAGRSVGLSPERRAEGYALIPSREAAVMGLPHLRVAVISDLLTVWVRAPYSLGEERCTIAGIDAGELYEMILAGAMRIAEIMRKHSTSGEFVQISLP
jgi:hypothetical protein